MNEIKASPSIDKKFITHLYKTEQLLTHVFEELDVKPPYISVVIPIYNSEGTIERTIRSIGNSPLIEIIAMVDGSPDNSKYVLQGLKSEFSNLKIFEHPNTGGARTLNRGLKNATGTYVTFMDGDDYFIENGLSKLFKAALVNQFPEIVIGRLVKNTNHSVAAIYDQLCYTDDGKFSPNNFDSIIASIPRNPKNFLMDSFYTGKLFKKSFLEKNNIWFNPNLLYADRPFFSKALTRADKVFVLNSPVAFWWKDKQNASITNKITNFENFQDRIISYFDAKFQLASIENKEQKTIYREAFDFYVDRRVFWPLKRLPKFGKDNRRYLDLAHYYLSSSCLTSQNISAGISPVPKKVKRYINHLRLRRVVHLGEFAFSRIVSPILTRLNRAKLLPRKPYRPNIMPVDKTLIVFESFFGKEYGGQPKYIYEELLKTNKYFKAVWVYNPVYSKHGHEIPGEVQQVARGSAEYFDCLARAGYWVNNIKFPVKEKPNGTTYLQTWHGTPLKKLSSDIEVTEGPEVEAIKAAHKESKTWDFMLAQNEFSEQVFKRAYKLGCPVLNAGYPATDAIIGKTAEKYRKELRGKYNIPENKKIITYAPTWRDQNQKKEGVWEFGFKLPFDLAALKEKFGDEYVLCLRMHHLVKEKFVTPELEGFVYDWSSEPDATRILSATDVLITDYSSIFFDFAISGRPILFYMHDLDEYANQTRGLYLDVFNELPGPVSQNQGELIEHLEDISGVEKSYNSVYKSFQERFLSLQDGKSSQKIVEQVFKDVPEKW